MAKFLESETVGQFGHVPKPIVINIDNIAVIQPDEYIDHLNRRISCTILKLNDGRSIQIITNYSDVLLVLLND